jgi:hypothetical protein
MSTKPEIERIQVLHDLQTHFEVPEAVRTTLESQLSTEDQAQIERFFSGFMIEDVFEWIFSAMPWVNLIHAHDQQQFPMRSKANYQVPDFLILVETSALEHRPLLVDVKRMQKDKLKLELKDSQVALCERYAAALEIPLVYAVYWERFGAWTLNTPDTFERKSSSRKLQMTSALELDCGAILGDISFMVPPSVVRVSRFSTEDVTESSVRHHKHGRLVSDIVSLGERRVEMDSFESAAIDSMLVMTTVKEVSCGNGVTERTETLNDFYVPKLSSWITRHIAIFSTKPSEQYAHASACTITELMKKLDCQVVHLFPSGRSKQLEQLDEVFRNARKDSAT